MATGKNTHEDAGSIRHQEYLAAQHSIQSEEQAIAAAQARHQYECQQEDAIRAAGLGAAGILGELES